ncbi:ribonuclease kappa-B [Caerostris extrusa]|uniref:Ribonuclease kappa-B n=1 Tax=Caerostris extrusa TaxID=172846 RepID=A0AAV4R0U5_CAEEX|nr:ribonuclease kappa-B [Caerostris extrusa]
MISLRFCGPKLSICCSILSVWGIIMLVILGILLGVNSAAFAEDLDLERFLKTPEEFKFKMNNEYTVASHNCLIAACLYVLSLCVSVWQYYLNRRATSTTT